MALNMHMIPCRLFWGGLLTCSMVGCLSSRPDPRLSRTERDRAETVAQTERILMQRDAKAVYLARSQSPEVLPTVPIKPDSPSTKPTTPGSVLDPFDDDPLIIRRRTKEPPRLPTNLAPEEKSAPSQPQLQPPIPMEEGGGLKLIIPAELTKPVAPYTKPAESLTPVAGSEIKPIAASEKVKLPEAIGDSQVRVVANIGQTPIYDSEVREAIYSARFAEYMRVPDFERPQKYKQLYQEELRKIVERELILDEMYAFLSEKKKANLLTKLKEAASKEADNKLAEFKKMQGVSSEEEFRQVLNGQGLTVSGIRRQIERQFMMQMYFRDRYLTRVENIGLNDIRDYYDTHKEEFKSEAKIKWLDIFLYNETHGGPQKARAAAEALVNRARKEDFAELASQFSEGDSKDRRGEGLGEKPGEIFPPELEPTLLKLKPGDMAIIPNESGFHIVKVVTRTYDGYREFDEKVQSEIRRKIQIISSEREYKKVVETLWKRIQPQIWYRGE